MAESAKEPTPLFPSNPTIFDKRQVKDVTTTYSNELIFALCGPIGSPIHEVAKTLKEYLTTKFQYDCQIITLSDFITSDLRKNGGTIPTDEYEILKLKIDHGNKMRETFGPGILAEHAIYQMNKERLAAPNKERRICYVIDSLKNITEHKTLKNVYQDAFYTLGVFSDYESRYQKINESIKEPEKISKLIDRDSGEEIMHGQSVREIFQLSDYFINANHQTSTIKNKVERFLNLVFETEVITPTPHENAMYTAASVSGNSACLSRQVGACITDSAGNILSVGWNDVPKSKGGVYGNADIEDKRCFNLGGKCYNDEQKDVILYQIADILIDDQLISKFNRDKTFSALKQKKSKINDIIEFSRAIHAEMLAIIQGGINSGSKMVGGKLYSTTYPCHFCVKHILAAGISEVYYIEPYRKSLATHLHKDSISENPDSALVKILPFDGASPKKYFTFFKNSANKRKDEKGHLSLQRATEALPKVRVTLESIPVNEGLIVSNLITKKAIDVPKTDIQ